MYVFESNVFWSQDAGLVEDPTRFGVNPHDFMKELLEKCLNDDIIWDFKKSQGLTQIFQRYLDNKYKMYSPKVLANIKSCINYKSLCSNTYVGKFKHSTSITELHKKYGLFIIQLKEVETIYSYIWIPYTESMEGRDSYLSTDHDSVAWVNLLNECIAKLNKKKLIKHNEFYNILTKALEQMILKNI
jgi:hypothetical protein